MPWPGGARACSRPGKVVIGGAGITGLCCGYELMKAGFDVTILEAAGRYGGHVFTGRDGLSDGLYADFGADHITKPGYERLLDYAAEFDIRGIPYPNAEGAWLPYDNDGSRMIGGKLYTNRMLAEPATLARLGFNGREVRFLAQHPWYELESLYLRPYVDRLEDPYHPFGMGLDDLDKIPITAIYKKAGASQAAIDSLATSRAARSTAYGRLAAKKSRRIPPSEGEMFRLQGGNEQLPIAFARRLGTRVKLAHPITAIRQERPGRHRELPGVWLWRGQDRGSGLLRELHQPDGLQRNSRDARALTCKAVRGGQPDIFVTPVLRVRGQLQILARRWPRSINMEFDHPEISSIWEVPTEMRTTRVLLKAYGPGGLVAATGAGRVSPGLPGQAGHDRTGADQGLDPGHVGAQL